MKKYENLLTKLGLSESEKDIYLLLLQHPYKLISDIAQITKYHRPTVYKAIRSLESDGLVGKSYLDGKRYYYHATHPEKLKEKLHHLTHIAEKLIPELEIMHDKKYDTPILSIKEGLPGIQEIHLDLVKSLPVGGIYYRYSSSKKEYGKRFGYVNEEYFEIQKEKNLERCVISNEARTRDHSGNPNRDIVAIPTGFDLFDDNITKIIYGDTVAIIDYNSQTGWTIKNERFARYEEKIFRLLHGLLKEGKNKNIPI